MITQSPFGRTGHLTPRALWRGVPVAASPKPRPIAPWIYCCSTASTTSIPPSATATQNCASARG